MYIRRETPSKKSPSPECSDFELDEDALEMLGDLALDEDIEDDVDKNDINRGIINDKAK